MAAALAVILTLLLFVVGPPPKVALEPAGTSGATHSESESSPSKPVPSPLIELSVDQGTLPIWWDEREQLLVQSQPALISTPIEFALAGSGWTRTVASTTSAAWDDPGRSVGLLRLPMTDDPPLIDSSDLPPASPQVTSAAHLGVAVEKIWLSDRDQHESHEYTLIVTNQSAAAVERVIVRDVVPDINQIVNVSPSASVTPQGVLMWQLGTMDAGAELQLSVAYLPAETGAFETLSVVDLQSRIGAVTLVTDPFAPEPVVVSPEPVVTEPEMILPPPVLPAELAADPAPVLPDDDEMPAQLLEEPVADVFPFPIREPAVVDSESVLPVTELIGDTAPVLPVDDEMPPPLEEPVADVFPYPIRDPGGIQQEPVIPAADPPAVVMPATPIEERPVELPLFDRSEPVPRPRPLADVVPQRPLLRVQSASPESVARGEIVTTIYEIRNEGTAAAENVKLTVHLTDELLHRHGTAVRHIVERLEPGETTRARLLTRARQAGTAVLDAALTLGDENADSELSYIRITTAGASQSDGDWGASEAASREPPVSPADTLR